jgi:hypothetical protein
MSTTETYYRIQNVEFETFLALTDIEVDFKSEDFSASLAMRPLTEDDDKSQQQWTLRRTNNSYWIESVYSENRKGKTCKFYLTSNEGQVNATIEDPDDDWAINLSAIPEPNVSFRISWTKEGPTLHLNDDGDFAVDQSQVADPWRLVEVWPTMATGVYRLRSLNGRVLTYSENRKWCAETLGGKQEYKQSWRVEGKPNGKCVIRLSSSSQDGYLVKYDDGNDGKVRMDSNKDFEWTLESVGGFAYSIIVDYPPQEGLVSRSPVEPVDGGRANFQRCLALTVTNDTDITLKPSKCGHGQIWLFEWDNSENK